MKLTRLRLIGFKSFVEPTDFLIEPGLNGVVGPNGCGKSNLVEALRWVMGESSYKSMRASSMDEVIFSGTNNRPARNNAACRAVIGAGKNHLVHRGGAHGFIGGLAHHPAQRFDQVGFAAAVRPDHTGEPRLDQEIGRLDERLEPDQAQPRKLHRSGPEIFCRIIIPSGGIAPKASRLL